MTEKSISYLILSHIVLSHFNNCLYIVTEKSISYIILSHIILSSLISNCLYIFLLLNSGTVHLEVGSLMDHQEIVSLILSFVSS